MNFILLENFAIMAGRDYIPKGTIVEAVEVLQRCIVTDVGLLVTGNGRVLDRELLLIQKTIVCPTSEVRTD
jgi:hypothetical protein